MLLGIFLGVSVSCIYMCVQTSEHLPDCACTNHKRLWCNSTQVDVVNHCGVSFWQCYTSSKHYRLQVQYYIVAACSHTME